MLYTLMPIRVARVAREARWKHLAHVSGIGSDPQSPARYIKARGEGEQAVQRAFANATLISAICHVRF